MARKRLADIKPAVFKTAKSVTGSQKMYSRVRYPDDFQDAKVRQLYADDSGQINVWFIFLVERASIYNDNGVLLHVDYTFQIMGIVSVVDSDTDELSSNAKVESLIESLADAFDDDIELGLEDAGVSHSGARIRIAGGIQGAYQAHIVEGRITVRAEDC